ncbi:MAG: pyridoxamine 5'-phosphate oxidase family protein [Treponemataceae bacterium]|nr:pyridoxamine 5'-phosphate oxidase family protein [Treponemataceae bacterium]
MFRKMRREKQQLSREETLEILKNGKTAILALSGDDGYPYAVPVNYVFCEAQENPCDANQGSFGKILFHGAKIGHKIDALKRCQKVSLCVIQKDDVIKEKLSTAYKSVIVFGTARILQDEEEIFRAAEILGLRYNEDAQFVRDEIRRTFDALSCVEIQIEHATGKQGSIFLKKD